MLKKAIFFFISLVAGIALFIGVIRFVGWQELKSSLDIFADWHGLVILLLTVLVLFIGACKWRVILSSQGYNLAIKETFRVYLAGFSLSYLFPIFMGGGTGTVLRGYILRERFSIPWHRGAASLIIEMFLKITVALVVILAGFVFLLSKMGLFLGDRGIFFSLALTVFTGLVAFLYFKFFRSESVIGFFAKFFRKNHLFNGTLREIEQDIFEFFEPKKAAFWKALGLAFLKVAVLGFRAWILILFLGKFLNFPQVVPVLAFYFLTLFIPVPAMLGTHELSQSFAFSLVGVGTSLAPAFTMILRVVEIIMALAGFIILFKLGADLIKIILQRRFDYLLH